MVAAIVCGVVSSLTVTGQTSRPATRPSADTVTRVFRGQKIEVSVTLPKVVAMGEPIVVVCGKRSLQKDGSYPDWMLGRLYWKFVAYDTEGKELDPTPEYVKEIEQLQYAYKGSFQRDDVVPSAPPRNEPARIELTHRLTFPKPGRYLIHLVHPPVDWINEPGHVPLDVPLFSIQITEPNSR